MKALNFNVCANNVSYQEQIPLFSLDIVIQDGKIAPVVALEQFVEIPSQLFQKSLSSLQMMQRIESIVMAPLFSKGGEIPIMNTVQLCVFVLHVLKLSF